MNAGGAIPVPGDRPSSIPASSVPHWFDVICPFCYVAQQRNDVLEARGLNIIRLPFQVHPEIPPGGVDAGPRAGPMYAALEREAARAGLPLNWPARLPDTGTALAAAEWVRLHRPDVSDAFIGELFTAHFVLGEDLGDRAVIERHAGALGVDLDALRAALASGVASASLAGVRSLGARLGVRVTPSWLIAGELISGLLPVWEFERLAEKASAHRHDDRRRADAKEGEI
ncbi:DsbA family protein [Microbispora sp. RL4-1S]|uniref:DsbA family protein n=1 Tax=Microbispora oryzae TaxID=2806554 RepID=A0A940WN48_9ACTN|nr:DsbA family protein [Microbispora oryzae]MBP2706907.1 DsbA family protein [Microbispora oryzae]